MHSFSQIVSRASFNLSIRGGLILSGPFYFVGLSSTLFYFLSFVYVKNPAPSGVFLYFLLLNYRDLHKKIVINLKIIRIFKTFLVSL